MPGNTDIPPGALPPCVDILALAPESCRGTRNRPNRTGIMNPVKALENHGQAVWLDFLARGFVAKGDLKKLIDTDGVKGVTSNPSIFEKAIGSSDEYDGAIGQALKSGDRPVADLFEHLAIEDIQHAADVLRPVYDHLERRTTVSSASKCRPIWRWIPKARSPRPSGSGKKSTART